MLEPALAAGRWMVVEADTLMKFGGTSGSELKEKEPRPGMPAASLRASLGRSKREANASKQNKQSASSKPREAKPKQTMKQTVKQNEALASSKQKQPVPNLTILTLPPL